MERRPELLDPNVERRLMRAPQMRCGPPAYLSSHEPQLSSDDAVCSDRVPRKMAGAPAGFGRSDHPPRVGAAGYRLRGARSPDRANKVVAPTSPPRLGKRVAKDQ